MDAIADLAYGTVLTPPSPATSGTTIVLNSGMGASFPAAPFDVLMWPPTTAFPTQANAEQGRCTNITGDTLTVTRAQYGSSAQSIAANWQVCQPVNKNLLSQFAALIPAAQQLLTLTRVQKRVLSLSSQSGSGTGYAWTAGSLAFDTDDFDVVELTNQSTAFTIANPSGSPSPLAGDSLRIAITDGGTSKGITWGSSFVSGGQTLPGNTLGGGGSPITMYVELIYNAGLGKWVCVAASPQPSIVVQDSTNWAQTASTNYPITTSDTTIFNPTLTQGNWLIIAVLTIQTATSPTAGAKVNAGLASGTGYTVQTPTGHPVGSFLKLPSAAGNFNAGVLVVVAYVNISAGTATPIISVKTSDATGTPQVAAADNTIATNTEESVCWCIPQG